MTEQSMPQTTVRLSAKYVLTGLPDGTIRSVTKILNYPSLFFHAGDLLFLKALQV